MAARNGRPAKRQHEKKIYISVDFEGAACVVGFPGKPMEPLGSGLEMQTAVFKQAQRLVTAEVNAAVRGALAAGAVEVIVDDNHGGGHNLLYDELHPEAKVLIGGPRPRRFYFLDDSFTGIVLLCYHAMSGVREGVLSHSFSSVAVHKMLLNGHAIGEIGLDAALAGELGVPVLFVSADEAGCREARKLLGEELQTVATKRGLGRNCALSLSPLKAQQLTEEGVKRAINHAHLRSPHVLKGPHVFEQVFKWEAQADSAARERPGAERIDDYRVRWHGKNVMAFI